MRLIDADALKEKAFGKRGGLIHTEDIDNAPTIQPTVADCWGCNCPKMERLKEQKTFSEMIHLHDAETHDKRAETHACDSISRQDAIEAYEKIGRAFNALGLDCAYDMPSFWCNGKKDYRVIPTKYHKGYQKALEDAEKKVKEILEELCYG